MFSSRTHIWYIEKLEHGGNNVPLMVSRNASHGLVLKIAIPGHVLQKYEEYAVTEKEQGNTQNMCRQGQFALNIG